MSSEPSKTPHSPPQPPGTTSSSAFKSVKVVDLGDRWEVQLPRRPVFTIPKEGAERYLETFEKLPQPEGLTKEEVRAVLEAIEGLRGQRHGRRDWFMEALAEAVAKTSATAPTTGATEEIRLVELPEDILEGKPRAILTRVASELARQLVELYGVKVPVVNDTPLGIYCYEGGAYVECEEKLLRGIQYYYDYYGLEERGLSLRSLIAETMTHIKNSAKVFRGFDHHLLLFKNGILDWGRLENGGSPRVEPSPEYMILHRIDHEVDWSALEDSSCYENLEKCIEERTPFFRKVFEDWAREKWILLYEVIGYTLYTKGYPFSKAVMLVGEGSNGKSTYLELVKTVLGSRNVTSITLQEITSDKFAGSELFGKLANIYADLPNEMLRQTGKFKILTGEDYVCFDRKYAKRRVCFTNYAKLIFSCNRLPAVTDTTLAFWRRWIVVEFPNQFPDNPKFKEEVVKHPEIPSLIALSVLAFRRVLERGRFSYQEEAVDYREVWMRTVDPVYDFIRFMEERGFLARDKSGRVEDGVLYELYVKYHDEYREDEVVPKKTFTERLESYGIVKKKVKNRKYYVGITLLKPREEIKEELESGSKEEEAPEEPRG